MHTKRSRVDPVALSPRSDSDSDELRSFALLPPLPHTHAESGAHTATEALPHAEAPLPALRPPSVDSQEHLSFGGSLVDGVPISLPVPRLSSSPAPDAEPLAKHAHARGYLGTGVSPTAVSATPLPAGHAATISRARPLPAISELDEGAGHVGDERSCSASVMSVGSSGEAAALPGGAGAAVTAAAAAGSHEATVEPHVRSGAAVVTAATAVAAAAANADASAASYAGAGADASSLGSAEGEPLLGQGCGRAASGSPSTAGAATPELLLEGELATTLQRAHGSIPDFTAAAFGGELDGQAVEQHPVGSDGEGEAEPLTGGPSGQPLPLHAAAPRKPTASGGVKRRKANVGGDGVRGSVGDVGQQERTQDVEGGGCGGGDNGESGDSPYKQARQKPKTAMSAGAGAAAGAAAGAGAASAVIVVATGGAEEVPAELASDVMRTTTSRDVFAIGFGSADVGVGAPLFSSSMPLPPFAFPALHVDPPAAPTLPFSTDPFGLSSFGSREVLLQDPTGDSERAGASSDMPLLALRPPSVAGCPELLRFGDDSAVARALPLPAVTTPTTPAAAAGSFTHSPTRFRSHTPTLSE